jgi:hypothetical protein
MRLGLHGHASSIFDRTALRNQRASPRTGKIAISELPMHGQVRFPIKSFRSEQRGKRQLRRHLPQQQIAPENRGISTLARLLQFGSATR